LIAFGLLAVTPHILTADLLDYWQVKKPFPTSNLLYGVAFGNGVVIAARDVGTIITSPDGVN